jgi:transposase-like protein
MSTVRKTTRRPHRRFTAREKCQAILLLWTEKRSGADLARDLGVTWTLLSQWQDLAMAGMLAALEPKRPRCPHPSPLNRRLEQLLARKAPASPPPPPGPVLNPALAKRLADPPPKAPESSTP